jgi:hypothetical protein
MPTEEWFEERVLRGLALFARNNDGGGATCEKLNGDYVDFWPLYPLQRLYRMKQIGATLDGKRLTAKAVASLQALPTADTVVWHLTETGQTRVAQIKQIGW